MELLWRLRLNNATACAVTSFYLVWCFYGFYYHGVLGESALMGDLKIPILFFPLISAGMVSVWLYRYLSVKGITKRIKKIPFNRYLVILVLIVLVQLFFLLSIDFMPSQPSPSVKSSLPLVYMLKLGFARVSLWLPVSVALILVWASVYPKYLKAMSSVTLFFIYLCLVGTWVDGGAPFELLAPMLAISLFIPFSLMTLAFLGWTLGGLGTKKLKHVKLFASASSILMALLIFSIPLALLMFIPANFRAGDISIKKELRWARATAVVLLVLSILAFVLSLSLLFLIF